MRRRTFHINIAEVAVRCQAVFGSVIQKALVHLWEVLVSATVIDADCRCLREFTDARTDAVRCDRNDVQTVRIGVRRYLNAHFMLVIQTILVHGINISLTKFCGFLCQICIVEFTGKSCEGRKRYIADLHFLNTCVRLTKLKLSDILVKLAPETNETINLLVQMRCIIKIVSNFSE